MPTITVIGSLNYDVVTTYSRLPNAGETVPAKNFETHNGGKGANQALACARLRTKGGQYPSVNVKIIGCVGDDTFGCTLKEFLSKSNVDISAVRTLDKSTNIGTGVATILVDEKSGQNRILVYPGANSLVSKIDVLCAIIDPETNNFNTDSLILQNEIPVSLVQDIIKTTTDRKLGKKPFVIYNPSPIDASFDSNLYKYVECLIVNSTEAKAIVPENVGSLLVDDDNAEQALQAAVPIFQALNLPKYLIITLGAAGCVYVDGTVSLEARHLPAVKPPKPIIDTTGAGDTFLGAIASQLTEDNGLDQALKVALTASSIAITRKGAGDGIPEFRELVL
ncbi:uncharacterized protein SAPINGB_P001076 [Magnusiomyces paraingens]|uniref:Ribokinase n=1 Tax=Magnusiomyces paraingens TaxID=2606893 RepID=A0A5E8BA27_9ASCO|nr:uncharacterized protein SAPINGB_P001076 [Saprochaete ingens]VVT46160.1 unnamed protein product [Saprochaete ingens]